MYDITYICILHQKAILKNGLTIESHCLSTQIPLNLAVHHRNGANVTAYARQHSLA